MSYTETTFGYRRSSDKKRQPEFYMETTRTTRIVSILVYLVLLGQGDTYGYKYKPPLGGEGRIHRHPPGRTNTINIHPPWDTINTITTIETHHNQQPPQYTEQQKPIQAYIRQDKTPDIDFRDRHSYSPTVSPDTVRRDESAISDLAGHGFEEEGYPVVDYESALQTAMSTTVR
uniref:Ulp1 protease-like n=1 Tax=Oryza sativa subsp. japonica TaxID=39947 RepID=Q69V53_ORYSJ|nr:Ulp1 protease-like [Oryza sativa Japonica Group]